MWLISVFLTELQPPLSGDVLVQNLGFLPAARCVHYHQVIDISILSGCGTREVMHIDVK